MYTDRGLYRLLLQPPLNRQYIKCLRNKDLSVTMGNIIPDYVREFNSNPQGAPVHCFVPTYDPNFGFDGKRKEMKMVATVEEMDAAKIPPQNRDFCAHLLIEYKKCIHLKPSVMCSHDLHNWDLCQYDQSTRRVMEYEREFRLKQREIRMNKKANAEAMAA
ncbi:hypothetical protein TCAL_06393 [Tigriopus californicus]|uniref:NADH dehydrogenase [ubiquinone] 1 beta subcomplex subunit 7 n=1 Tax=Tigriopus californicus TaxID=6832 RepID=A0A553PAV5_TIGCA|nr:NADH dehydrogenase [ubiquinone] 1 beta subcomplex subunit 7-like [Tigriopus californicus]TRY74804.1 hypothetical protein TCAL_06393 [Tigriopus californicus]|eukprot:TCALIF_06393-PA protein Name:"Similar to D2030.4 NADH dehydrogenase [ubiquinone] 1 beta subcomplex subunit 7 (Caenorhabditis elegans)" AED:0.07 eAED:0.07 QI:26/1/1/1/0.5/0.66/3/68/160